ncbi:hypothetical protein [Pseudomonas sp. G2-4]|uniref:hypothetical protein n=1 Tax=Pseudomonas sp. G2-4 TaxID=1506334 RepID=UPI0024BA044B|nr:hypothetical protein [Pseudomonas sp. G2-4]WHS62250.1 hypothetical protein QNH97_09440 [Pseudomonas sp. G2-4]
MDVDKETKSAKKLWLWGLIIMAVSGVIILVSLLLSIYGYADYQGWDRVKHLVGVIYSSTQLPVLSTIWKLAAQMDFNDPLKLQNLGFFGEVIVFMVGAAMMGTANRTLTDIAKASHEATQERRKEQLKKQQEQQSEQQRMKQKEKDLS